MCNKRVHVIRPNLCAFQFQFDITPDEDEVLIGITQKTARDEKITIGFTLMKVLTLKWDYIK